jgi:hypothetical protein
MENVMVFGRKLMLSHMQDAKATEDYQLFPIHAKGIDVQQKLHHELVPIIKEIIHHHMIQSIMNFYLKRDNFMAILLGHFKNHQIIKLT